MKKSILGITMIAVILSLGCSIEEPPKGKSCSNLQYYQFESGHQCVTYEECKEFTSDNEILNAIKSHLCPDLESFECVKISDTEGSFYCKYVMDGMITCNGTKINPMSDKNYCGAKGKCNEDDKDSENWKGMKCSTNENCTAGICERMVNCGFGTHYEGDECVSDTGDNCGISHVDCNAKDLFCYNGVCVSECPNGSIECGRDVTKSIRGICVDPSNSAYCGAKEGSDVGICIEYQTCGLNQSCVEGNCVCNEGFHLVGTEGNYSCEKNTAEACGSRNAVDSVNCNTIEHASNFECINGKCSFSECEDNYHIYKNGDDTVCEADTVEHCGDHETRCEVENAENSCAGSSGSKRCVFDCKGEYHKSPDGASCEANASDNCGPEGVVCSEKPGWKTGHCDVSKCVAETCQDKYHLYNGECEEDNLDHCGNHDTQCNVAHADNFCNNAECTFTCNDQYRPKDNSCVDSSADNCGDGNLKCSDEVPGWVRGTCENGECVVAECDNSHFLSGKVCAVSDDKHCGSATTSCEIAHGTQKCQNNQCVMVGCETNYHVDLTGHGCSENSVNNCGQDGYICSEHISNWNGGNCTTDGKCKVTSCKNNTHVFASENKCEANTTSNCGSHGNSCGTDAHGTFECTSETCVLTCSGNYHLASDGKSCEADSVSACGSAGYKCSEKVPGWSNGNCTNKQCVATACNDGYHLYEKTCEPETPEHCGDHNTSCEEGEYGYATCEKETNKYICKFNCWTYYHMNSDGKCVIDSTESCGVNEVNCTDLEGWDTGVCVIFDVDSDVDKVCNATSCKGSMTLSYTGGAGMCMPEDSWRRCWDSEKRVLCPDPINACCEDYMDCLIIYMQKTPDESSYHSLISDNHCTEAY